MGAGPPWAPGLTLKSGKMTFFFEFAHASTGHSFQAIDTKFFRRIALLLEKSPLKIWGVGPPWGKFFPPIFFQDIDLKICVCHARDPGTARLKNFHDRSHRGGTVAMNVCACRQGPRARQTPVTSAAAVHRYTRTIDKRAGLLLVV